MRGRRRSLRTRRVWSRRFGAVVSPGMPSARHQNKRNRTKRVALANGPCSEEFFKMIDSFVLLAPVLLLIVVALLRFVGCTFVPGKATLGPPTFNPPAGTYTGAQSVTLSADSGEAIYFTTDGSTPLAPDSPGGPSPLYDGASINVAVNTTIGAIAAETGFSDSAPAFAAYVINTAPPPPIVFQPPVSEKDETTNSITVATPAFTRNVTAGNLMVVWLWYRSTAQTIASVTDSAGNNYQRAVGPTVGAGT